MLIKDEKKRKKMKGLEICFRDEIIMITYSTDNASFSVTLQK